jgi:transposase/transposase-like protein
MKVDFDVWMSGGRRKEIVRHLSEDDLHRLLAEFTDEKLTERLIFVKRLYKGATLEDAADDVGRSSATGTRWARRWNKGGLGLLMPNFGGGRPPKLGEEQQQRLLELLREGQLWKKQEIQHLINEEFKIEFHPAHLTSFLEKSASPPQFRGLSAHHGQGMLKRYSSNASWARSRGLSKRGRGTYEGDKPLLLTLVVRDSGQRCVVPAKSADEATVRLLLDNHEKESLTVYTDGFWTYNSLDDNESFNRGSVIHGEVEYIDVDAHVDTCERRPKGQTDSGSQAVPTSATNPSQIGREALKQIVRAVL